MQKASKRPAIGLKSTITMIAIIASIYLFAVGRAFWFSQQDLLSRFNAVGSSLNFLSVIAASIAIGVAIRSMNAQHEQSAASVLAQKSVAAMNSFQLLLSDMKQRIDGNYIDIVPTNPKNLEGHDLARKWFEIFRLERPIPDRLRFFDFVYAISCKEDFSDWTPDEKTVAASVMQLLLDTSIDYRYSMDCLASYFNELNSDESIDLTSTRRLLVAMVLQTLGQQRLRALVYLSAIDTFRYVVGPSAISDLLPMYKSLGFSDDVMKKAVIHTDDLGWGSD